MRLYLDASPIIYSLEGQPAFRTAALSWINQARAASEGLVLTSRLSKLECRSKPLAADDRPLLERYDAFFALLELGADDETLIHQATELRARFGLRSLDALHLATAIRERADVFLTGDKNLRRCSDVNVVVLS